MNKRIVLPVAVGLAVVGFIGFAALADGGHEDEVTLDQMPAAARAVILAQAAGAPISEIERETTNGVTVYEAEWVVDGTEHEVAVTADGELLELEETVPVSQVPAAVQAVIAEHFGAGAQVVVEKKMIVMYEVEAKVNGKEIELCIFPSGQVHEAGPHDHDDEEDGHDDDHHEHDHDHGHGHSHGHDHS
jgi:hypothetical protein